MKDKKVVKVISPEHKHWVGNGFNVHTMIHPSPGIYEYSNPFILLDYAPEKVFPKTSEKLGVGAHPHRGFETVTFAIQGEVEHRDSSGGGGVIKEGDIQWMTAAAGIVHEEFHSRDFAQTGGPFEMVQLWVNLPKKDKFANANYQGIKNESCPRINIGQNSELKLIAGEYESKTGPSNTFTDISVYDINAKAGDSLSFDFKENTNTLCLVLRGKIEVDSKNIQKESILLYSKEGEKVEFKSLEDSRLLVLNGTPIDEPIVAHGPFVMNTRQEIIEAIEDYQNGKMGTL